MINKVFLIGNLGADPEVRTLDTGTKVARFSLATNENYRDKSGEWQTQTEWHNITCWRYLAERAETSLKKGSMVYIEGKISYRKWQDQEGKDRYTTDIVANTFRMLDRREGGSVDYENRNFPDSEPNYIGSGPTSQPATSTDNVSKSPENSDTPAMEDDDLPF